MEYRVVRSDELTHWGIKGMKWGIRRYQNEDGTLTEAGKKRYYYQNPDGSLTEEGKKNYMTGAKKGKIDPKKLSDADLNMINSRFARENTFKQNVENYQKSKFSYKAKEALLARIKGNGGGGGGGGKKGGSKIGNLLAMPIKKAFEDAFKFDPNKGGNDDGGQDFDDETKAAYKRWKKGGKFVESYKDDRSLRQVRKERGKRFLDSASRDWTSGEARTTGSRSAEEIVRSRHKKSAPKPVVSYAAKQERKRQSIEDRAAKSGIQIAWHSDLTNYRVSRLKDDELMHYGIKGQKWGVRRFENQDGTLTEAGKERYGHGSQGTKSGRTKDLVGISTNRESEYVNSCGTLAQDPKIRRQLHTIISNSKDPAVQMAVSHANEWKSASEKLRNSYDTFSERLMKDRGGKVWDGDGTEEHWEMEKRYPEYRDISRKEQIALKNLVESSISLAKSKEFANVKGFEKSKNYFDSFPEYGDWFKKGDQRAYPIAMTLLGGRDTNKYFEVWPEYFIESFDSSGNKIDTKMFDID